MRRGSGDQVLRRLAILPVHRVLRAVDERLPGAASELPQLGHKAVQGGQIRLGLPARGGARRQLDQEAIGEQLSAPRRGLGREALGALGGGARGHLPFPGFKLGDMAVQLLPARIVGRRLALQPVGERPCLLALAETLCDLALARAEGGILSRRRQQGKALGERPLCRLEAAAGAIARGRQGRLQLCGNAGAALGQCRRQGGRGAGEAPACGPLLGLPLGRCRDSLVQVLGKERDLARHLLVENEVCLPLHGRQGTYRVPALKHGCDLSLTSKTKLPDLASPRGERGIELGKQAATVVEDLLDRGDAIDLGTAHATSPVADNAWLTAVASRRFSVSRS